MRTVLEIEKLERAIWVANIAINEAENNKQEWLIYDNEVKPCNRKKVVTLLLPYLRRLVESAQYEINRTEREVREMKEREKKRE